MSGFKTENYKFFSHKECEYFPCHETSDPDNFNCLFCFCPLYALGEACGGGFTYTENGCKDCSQCMIPHDRDNYDFIMDRFEEIKALTARKVSESREVEIKYAIPTDCGPEAILLNSVTEEYECSEVKEIDMQAFYLDTPRGDLRKAKAALRYRFENGEPVATAKWGGSSENGLHDRGEVNMPVDEKFLAAPGVEIFRDTEAYAALRDAEGKKLSTVMVMNFTRRQISLRNGAFSCVLSYDLGSIITPNGTVPIREAEIELSSGSVDAMLELGQALADMFKLTALNESKYARGLKMLE